MRIYPMPKIEFKNNYAKTMNFIFEVHKHYHVYIEYMDDDCVDISLYEEFPIKPNQTFKEAVTEWISAWVRENFEPIILPDESYSDGLGSCYRVYEFYELNKNIIKVEE